MGVKLGIPKLHVDSRFHGNDRCWCFCDLWYASCDSRDLTPQRNALDGA